jgi:hypothetical protein
MMKYFAVLYFILLILFSVFSFTTVQDTIQARNLFKGDTADMRIDSISARSAKATGFYGSFHGTADSSIAAKRADTSKAYDNRYLGIHGTSDSSLASKRTDTTLRYDNRYLGIHGTADSSKSARKSDTSLNYDNRYLGLHGTADSSLSSGRSDTVTKYDNRYLGLHGIADSSVISDTTRKFGSIVGHGKSDSSTVADSSKKYDNRYASKKHGITDGCIPYAVDSVTYNNAPIFTDGTYLGIGNSYLTNARLTINSVAVNGLCLRLGNGINQQYRNDWEINSAGMAIESYDDSAHDYLGMGWAGKDIKFYSHTNDPFGITFGVDSLLLTEQMRITNKYIYINGQPGNYAIYPGKMIFNGHGIDGPNAVGGIEFIGYNYCNGIATKLYSNYSNDEWGIATRRCSGTWTERLIINATTGAVKIPGLSSGGYVKAAASTGELSIISTPDSAGKAGVANDLKYNNKPTFYSDSAAAYTAGVRPYQVYWKTGGVPALMY